MQGDGYDGDGYELVLVPRLVRVGCKRRRLEGDYKHLEVDGDIEKQGCNDAARLSPDDDPIGCVACVDESPGGVAEGGSDESVKSGAS